MKLSESKPTKKDIGKSVLFVPAHAKGNPNHKDCTEGIIKGINEDGTVLIKFLYDTKNCKAENLIWY